MAREQYEVRWKDYYEVLQVHPRAKQPVITAAFRKLAQLYHPDRDKSSDTTDRFKEINEAYEVLSNPTRRDRYDGVYGTRQDSVGFQFEPRQYEPTGPEWDAEPGPAAYSSYEGGRQRVEHGYPGSQAASESPKGFFADLAATLSPNPDESQCILPWPSWSWQRLSLMGAVPLGLLFLLISIGGAAWGALAVAVPFLVGSIYAGVATGWLRRSREAPLAARISGGASIVISGATYAAAVVAAILYGRFLILGVKIAAGMLREWWDREVSK